MSRPTRTQLFLSYATENREFVRRLRTELQATGVDVWLDEKKIRIGDDIRVSLERGIERSDYFAIVLSEASAKSKWVERELSAAFAREVNENRTFVLPLRMDNSKIPLMIAGKRYADFSTSFDAGLQALLDTIAPIVIKQYDCEGVSVTNARRRAFLQRDIAKTLHLRMIGSSSSAFFSALIVGDGDRESACDASDSVTSVMQAVFDGFSEIVSKTKVQPHASLLVFSFSELYQLANLGLQLDLGQTREKVSADPPRARMSLVALDDRKCSVTTLGGLCAIASWRPKSRRWQRKIRRSYQRIVSESFFATPVSHADLRSPIGRIRLLSENQMEKLKTRLHSHRDLRSVAKKIRKQDLQVSPQEVPFECGGDFVALVSHEIAVSDTDLESLCEDIGNCVSQEDVSRLLATTLPVSEEGMVSVIAKEPFEM